MEIKKISVNIVTVVAICLFLITTTIWVVKYYVWLEKRITLAEMNIAKKAET